MYEYHFDIDSPTYANLLHATNGDHSDSIGNILSVALFNERAEKHPFYRAVNNPTVSPKEIEYYVYEDTRAGLIGWLRKVLRRPTGLVGLIRFDKQSGKITTVTDQIKGTVKVQVLFDCVNLNRRA